MRFFVRSIAAAALALGGLACSESPTQPPDLASQLQGLWRYNAPPNNTPGGHFSFSLEIEAQGATVSGSATRMWIGPTNYVVTGTLQGWKVDLDGAGLYAGVAPVAFHFHGVLFDGGLLSGNLTETSDGRSSAYALTFRKSP